MRFLPAPVLPVAVGLISFAQPAAGPLFTDAPLTGTAAAAAAQPPEQAVADRRVVSLRLDRLFDDVDRPVLLNVGAHSWIARRERLDQPDVLGYRSWVGTIDGIEYSHVAFTERDGVVSGLINALSVTYEVHTVSPGIHALEQVDASRLPRESEPLLDVSGMRNTPELSSADAGPLSDDPGTFDVLMLYTPAA